MLLSKKVVLCVVAASLLATGSAFAKSNDRCTPVLQLQGNMTALEKALAGDPAATKARACAWLGKSEIPYLRKTSDAMKQVAKKHEPIGGEWSGDEMNVSQTIHSILHYASFGIYGYQSKSAKAIEGDSYQISLDSYLMAGSLESLCQDHGDKNDYYNKVDIESANGYLGKVRESASKLLGDFKCRQEQKPGAGVAESDSSMKSGGGASPSPAPAKSAGGASQLSVR